MQEKRRVQEKRREILEIAARHGAYNVRLFGSVAWGEEDNRTVIFEPSAAAYKNLQAIRTHGNLW